MKERSQVKIFKAVKPSTVIAQFIFPEEDIPEGWFSTKEQAIGAFKTEVTETAPRKAGRPRKGK